MRMKSLLIFLTLLVFSGTAYAETIKLKSRGVYYGKIIERNNTYITLSQGGAPLYLMLSEIESITDDPPGTGDGAENEFAGTVYEGKNFEISFKIPAGFSVVTETEQGTMLASADDKTKIIIQQFSVTPQTDMKMAGAQLISMTLNLESTDWANLIGIIKKTGRRTVGGQEAEWFYYPGVNNDCMIHLSYFVILGGQNGYVIESVFFPSEANGVSENFMAESERFANGFLDNFNLGQPPEK
ncbi:MAG: hypothetical protein KA403_09380 [Candidatus Omnitrophica bacterium]|nr:hypothetical protein [Candidatus Omnitrophota bacterium]